MANRTFRGHRNAFMNCRPLLVVAYFVFALSLAGAQTPERRTWNVNGVEREAFVFAPAAALKDESPVVFAFHGHGGNIRNVSERFGYQRLWPEAIVVYMQGLPSAGITDPDGLRPGWQKAVGELGDRDLKFFDAVLASLKKEFKVDTKRIYSTGHSNGGGFTYLLWAARGDVFAAVAPSAGGAARALRDLKPKPAMHVAGEKDETVPFENQKRTMDALRFLNGCDAQGKSWAPGCLLYPSKSGTPVVTMIHPGGHQFPAEAPPLIVKFFKEHALK